VRKKLHMPDARSMIECTSERKAREPSPAVMATRMSEPVRLVLSMISGCQA
jgi:hypothetical protein